MSDTHTSERLQIIHQGNALEALIKARREPAGIALSLVAMVAMPSAAIYAGSFVFQHGFELDLDNILAAAVLSVFILGGLGPSLELVWCIKGVEKISIDGDQITKTRIIPAYSRSESYDRLQVQNLRLAPESELLSRRKPRGWGGAIRFDYEGDIVQIADLDHEDAIALIEAIKSVAPRLAST